jgi:hypothetical protein
MTTMLDKKLAVFSSNNHFLDFPVPNLLGFEPITVATLPCTQVVDFVMTQKDKFFVTSRHSH